MNTPPNLPRPNKRSEPLKDTRGLDSTSENTALDLNLLNRLQKGCPPSSSLNGWLYAKGKYAFTSTRSSGKWCVHRSTTEIDEAWNRIKTVVEAGELLCAKVSAARKGDHVICVYTKDWEDAKERNKCRESLRKLGFTEKIGYKRDIDTLNGVYGTPDEWLCWA